MAVRKFLSTLAILSLPCVQALAIVCTGTWTGLGTPDDEWGGGITANWSNSCVPGGTTTDTAAFAGAAPFNVVLTISPTLQMLTFASATNYTLSPTGVMTFEATPTTQILVSSSSSPGHIIATDSDVAMGTNLEVTVNANNILNFYDYGIGDGGGGSSTITFNGAGTTNFVTNTITGVTLSPSGGLTVADGTVSLTNTQNISGACGGSCAGVIIGPPTITLSGGNFYTINNGNMSTSVLKSPGVVIEVGSVTPLTSITLSGGNWTNTNNGAISGSSTNYGTFVDSLSFSMSAGTTFASSNTNAVQNGAGCFLILNDFLMNGGDVTLTNSGAIVAAGDGTTGAAIECVTGVMNGGTVVLTNTSSGTLTGGGPGIGCLGCLLAFSTSFTMNGGYVGLFNAGTPSDYNVSQLKFGCNLDAATILLNGGTIENNDTVTAPTLNNTGGIVAGTGAFLGTSMTNSATVVPGSPTSSGTPGTMTIIAGNYTQTSAGNFTVNLKNTSTFSNLQVEEIMSVGGTATLDGTITIAASDGYSLANGDSFIVLQSVVLNGKFATIVNQLPPGFTPTVIYNADPSVEIILGSEITTTMPTFSGGFLGTIISSVNQLNQMDRLRKLACPPEKECCPVVKKGMWQKPSAPCKETKRDCEPHPWNVYVGPIGMVGGEFHSKKDQIGFDYWSAGALAGCDYSWTHFGVGMVFAYEHIGAHVHRHWGRFHVDEIHGSIYAKYTPAPAPDLAINAIVGGSYEFYGIDRNVSFSSFGIDETAKGKPQGSEFDSLLGLEYTVRVGDQGKLLPLAQLQYIYAAANRYTEHHAGVYDLKFHPQHIKSLRTALGLKGNYTWTWGNVSFTPEANVVWQREFSAKTQRIFFTSAAFAEPTDSLTMPGFGRNVLLAGIDLLATWNDTYSLEGRYNFEWNSLFHDHFLYLGFGIRF